MIEFADRLNNIKSSEIRETLKLLVDPEIISFAGGNPDEKLFPLKEINESCTNVLNVIGGNSLQYSTTEGLRELRAFVAKRMNNYGVNANVKNISIANGAQQALFLAGEVFLNKGDKVICESPTFFGALNAFKSKEIEILDIELKEDGINIEKLEETLKNNHDVKLIYVIPDFQNPTGWSWSVEKRKKAAELASKYDVILIEDGPYKELNYDGEILPSIKSFDKTGNVIFLGSFSKTFCPGFRLGWICAEEEIIKKFVLLKQGIDLQTSTFTQYVLYDFLQNNDYDEYIKKIASNYGKRLNIMTEIIDTKFPKECSYNKPKGGLFVWLRIPDSVNCNGFIKNAIDSKVAFIKGESFYPNGKEGNFIRLNFSNSSEEKIKEGMEKLSSIINGML